MFDFLREQRRARLQSQEEFSALIRRLASMNSEAQVAQRAVTFVDSDGTVRTSSGGPTGNWSPSGVPGVVRIPTGGRITWGAGVNPQTDRRLLADLQACLDELGYTVYLTDALRAPNARHGATRSRHKRGKALDIGLVNGQTARLSNQAALDMVRWFQGKGYVVEGTVGGRPGFLFGPCGHAWNPSGFDHSTHLHLSVP